MQSKAISPQDYIDTLPEDKKSVMVKLRNVMLKNLPEGFTETMQYGMLGYVVPHSLYPDGYHADPGQPLPFISIAAQKNYIAVYHMGLYSDMNLLSWFTKEWDKLSKVKLDMGKSCIRFKKPEHIPFGLLGELASKISPREWIAVYETQIKS